jgi:TolB protein
MMLPRRTILGAALTVATASAARAQLTIDMTKPSFEPVPIAVVDFKGDLRASASASLIVTTCRVPSVPLDPAGFVHPA